MNGYLKLQRKFYSHWLWEEKRTFSKAEAWLDLLQLAAYAPTKRIIRGQLIRLDEGECIASVRYLAVRWGWGKDKAAKFMLLLESDDMIRRMSRQGETIIFLCNYRDYTTSLDTDADRKADSGQTVSRQSPDTEQTKDKKVKKSKKDKSSITTQAIAWSATDSWSGISDNDLKQWSEAYPACDLSRQLASMNQWLLSNPSKAKKKQWRRFITNWLARQQERGGDGVNNTPPTSTKKTGSVQVGGRMGFIHSASDFEVEKPE